MEPGATIAGRYRLISLIGRGGMGEVWKAEHLTLRAPVAIKLVSSHIVSDPEALMRFDREAQAAAALRSTHVVQIFDHGVDPASQRPFIAMELLTGESLADCIDRLGTLTPAQTLHVVSHVARALTRAHEAGIVHRDLKPDNVFLVQDDDQQIAKVLDFGIAKTNALALTGEARTRSGSMLGTPFYMSPEQIGGSSKAADHRTDLWALAIITFECLLGRRPYDADTIGGLVLAICGGAPPRPSSAGVVPNGFDAWFERAAQRDPALRFQSAKELVDALRRVCGGEQATWEGPTLSVPGPSIRDAPTGPIESVSAMSRTASMVLSDDPFPAERRNRRIRAIAAGALITLGVAGGAVFLASGSGQPSGSASSSSSEVTGGSLAAPPAPDPPRPVDEERAAVKAEQNSSALPGTPLVAPAAEPESPNPVAPPTSGKPTNPPNSGKKSRPAAKPANRPSETPRPSPTKGEREESDDSNVFERRKG